MRSTVLFGAVLFTTLFVGVRSTRAEVVDRMMAVVNNRVVTLGDVHRHRDLARLFGDTVPRDEAALLDEVIEDLLIRDQIGQFPSIRISEEAVDEFVRQLGPAGGLRAEVVRDAARTRLERAEYFDLRFRRFTEPREEEIIDYYETVFLPEAEARGLDPLPGLEEVKELIGENVRTEKADREISAWVESLFRRSDVEVVE